MGLAYIGCITELHPIAKADRIESAVVVCGGGGKWSGVVKKGDFSLGDKCTAILQDAVCPPGDERWPFLESSGWRVRMARFRGAPSECVIIKGSNDLPIGTDVTETLGIKKYEKVMPVGMAGEAVGPFPSFIPKTDEPNFQTVPHLVEALRWKPFVATVKVDGSSGTAYRRGDHFGVCSRNLELRDGNNAYWSVAKKHGLHERLADGYAIQYEVAGPGIQKNPLGLSQVTGFAFSAWSSERADYLSDAELRGMCDALGMPVVEQALHGDCFDYSDDEIRVLAQGVYANGQQREGVVFRAADGARHVNERVSFKAINLLYKD
jgi:RNA ligase (TIGR02306 family)